MEDVEAIPTVDLNVSDDNKPAESDETDANPVQKNVSDQDAEDSDTESHTMAIEGIYNKTFRPFTKKSYEKLLRKEQEHKTAKKKNTDSDEGRLVDGEIVFDNDEDDTPKMTRDPKLVDGQTLPEKLGRFPKELEGIPLEEIDPYITHKVGGTV